MLAQRGVEIRLNIRVKGMTEENVFLFDGVSIPARNLVWTAGTAPSPIISSLPCAKERGRLLVDQFFEFLIGPMFGQWATVPLCQTSGIRGNLIRQPRNMPYAKAKLWRRISRLFSWAVL